MVNSEVETTNMTSSATETAPDRAKTNTEDITTLKAREQNGSAPEDQNDIVNTEQTKTKELETEVKIEQAPTMTKELVTEVKTEQILQAKSEDQSETKPSNSTQSASDESYKRMQSTFDALNSRVVYLVHWENTIHSGAALASILAFLVLTAYSSLVNILCGLALLVIGADWIWVVGANQFKTMFNYKAANPHEKYLKNPPQINKQDLYQYVDIWVDITNMLLVEATKVFLIEDPLRSMKYVVILYCTWTVLSWFSIRTLISIAVIAAFAVPKLYKQNKVLVDQHLEKAQGVAKVYIDRGVEVVGKNTGNIIPMAQKFAASKGWIANPDATKKDE